MSWPQAGKREETAMNKTENKKAAHKVPVPLDPETVKWEEEKARAAAYAAKLRQRFILALSRIKDDQAVIAVIEAVFKYYALHYNFDIDVMEKELPEAQERFGREHPLSCESFELAYAECAKSVLPKWCPELKARALKVHDWGASGAAGELTEIDAAFKFGYSWVEAAVYPLDLDLPGRAIIDSALEMLLGELSLRQRPAFARLHFISSQVRSLLNICASHKREKCDRIYFPFAANLALPIALAEFFDSGNQQLLAGIPGIKAQPEAKPLEITAQPDSEIGADLGALCYAAASGQTDVAFALEKAGSSAADNAGFDLILCDLPKTLSAPNPQRGGGEVSAENEAVNRLLRGLAPEGEAFICVSGFLLQRMGRQEVLWREDLARSGMLCAVLQLPDETYSKSSAAVRAELLLLIRKTPRKGGEVLMVNAKAFLNQKIANAQDESDKKTLAYADLEHLYALADGRTEESGVSRLVSCDELEAQQFILLPELYVRESTGEEKISPEQWLESLRAQRQRLCDLEKEADEIRAKFAELETRFTPLRL